MRRMGQPYHVGIVVPRLEDSMATLSAALGVEWSDVHVRGSAPSPVRVACSRGGAPHLELLEGPPDSLWASTGDVEIHHFAYWCEDLDESTRELAGAGYEVEADFGHARYLVASSSPRIELVARSAAPELNRLFGVR